MKSRLLTLTFTSLLLFACTSRDQRLENNIKEYVDSHQYRLAIVGIDQIVKRHELNDVYFWALREGVRVATVELKDYKKAVYYLDQISTDSQNFDEVIDAQKKKADIYFTNFQDYPRAVVEYGKLNLIAKEDVDKTEALLFVARSHFYMNQFKDAEIGVGTLLRMKLTPDQKFYTYQLLGNIKMAMKDFKSAEDIFLKVLKEFPQKAIEENIFLNVALVYEENNQIDRAIDILQQYREKYSPVEYVDLRIKRLMARKKNMPGARGFKK